MKIAVVGSGISGLGAAYLLARCTRRADVRAGRRARAATRTGRRDGLAPRHGLPRPQRAQLPAAHAPLRRARRRNAGVGHVVLGQLPRCGLEYSGRRPFAQPATPLSPRFLALLWEIGRWLRTARPSLDEPTASDWLARSDYLDERRLLAAFPPALPRPADLPRSGRRRRGARSSSRRRTRSASSRTTACSASAAFAGARSPAATTRTCDASPRGSATACALGAGVRSVRRGSDGVELTTADGERATLRRGRDRDARRPGARAARGPVARRAARARRVRVHAQRDDPAHRRVATCRPRALRVRRGTTGSATTGGRPSPTTSTGCSGSSPSGTTA